MKIFKKVISVSLSVAMLLSCIAINDTAVFAAPSISAGWNEALYAEWADANPDSPSVKVGYKLSTDSDYTYLEGADLEYLVRPASDLGYGRVDIPGLKEGRYDIEITASDGTKHERKGIKVYAYDRSGYAHWNYNGEGVGAYKNDGTPKDNAIIVYVTDENKDTVTVPGYENLTINYKSSKGNTWTKDSIGIGSILNNNHKLIRKITGPASATIDGINGAVVNCDEHPIIFRFIGKVTPPKNLTPYDAKTDELGGSKGDNGNLAITKYGKNITIEGIGDDAEIFGWGFTFSQTSTCPADAGESFEVRNLTFRNYSEDALGFQGDDGTTCPIKRVWVHNNVFYPGYANPTTASDKSEGDGSCDFKRGQYYTMSYNHYIKCHKTNLLGKGAGDEQYYVTLHHNWYEDVASRQPLAADGNIHIYNTYFQDTGSSKKHNTSQIIDLRGAAHCFSENNYFDNCKNVYNERNATSYLKTYNDMFVGDCTRDKISGKLVEAKTRTEKGPGDNGLTFPGTSDSIADWDTNSKYFYFANGKTDVEVLNDAADVPEYVKTYAGTLKSFPETESGTVVITVKSGSTPITDASVTANGLNFKNNNDGTYTATASLGAEYVITVSKEGYSNGTVISKVLEKDGDIFTASVDLPVDSDGYAVVSLTGGSDNQPVKGASIVLDNGTVLEDKNDGTYSSAAQLPVGEYKATVKNTGDYKAPADKVTVVVKTTDAPTEIHLDKEQGAVSVTLKAAEGETEPLNLSKAAVYVGETALTNSGNGLFTGNVDVGTPYEITISVPGWNVESITPSSITATKNGTASAEAVLTYKGMLYTWNYTDDTNTSEFFNLSAQANWSSASPYEFEGETLTKAIKVQSSLNITFDAPTDGELTIVIHSPKSGSTIELNGTDYPIPVDSGVTTMKLPVKAGSNLLKKGKNETHLYLLQYAGTYENVPDPDPQPDPDPDPDPDPQPDPEPQPDPDPEPDPDTDKLSDDVVWSVEDYLKAENGLSLGEDFPYNTEENGPVEFTYEGKTYLLENYVQAKSNPLASDGYNPANTTYIPVSGGYLKFEPEKNGVLTMAVKTNGGKITYVTDSDGSILEKVDNSQGSTTYDIIKVDVKSGKTYYIWAGASKISLYYIGYTSSGDTPATMLYGDASGNNNLASDDAALILQKVLKSTFVLPVENIEGYEKYLDVNMSGDLDAGDAAMVLQKVLKSTYQMTVEKQA